MSKPLPSGPTGHEPDFAPSLPRSFDNAGRVTGAVNLLVPVDGNAYRGLLAKAEKCRGLAQWMTDKRAKDVLTGMAQECEHQAAALRLD